MAPNKSTAQLLLEQADKKARSSPGWFSSTRDKWEEAADLYQSAANSFKIEKCHKEAGDAFAREADCREKGDELYSAANAWTNAAKSYKTGREYDSAIAAYNQCIVCLTKGGHFRQAAVRQKDLAEIHLEKNKDRKKDDPEIKASELEAIKCYNQAGEWYEDDDAPALASGLFTTAAKLSGTVGLYNEAITLFEKIAAGKRALEVTKRTARDMWFCAGLCGLAEGDIVGVNRRKDGYKVVDPGFGLTPEFRLLEHLVNAKETEDHELFKDMIRDHSQGVALDEWKLKMLGKIMDGMKPQPRASTPDLR